MNVTKQKHILAEGALNARERTLVLTDERELEDTLICGKDAGAGLLSRVAVVFCIFLEIAVLCKGSGLCELPVRLLGTMELPQAITEMCLQVVSCSDHLH